MKRFRGRLVFKARRLLYHSTLGLRVIKKREKEGGEASLRAERGVLPIGTVLNLRSTTLQKCAAVPRRARPTVFNGVGCRMTGVGLRG